MTAIFAWKLWVLSSRSTVTKNHHLIYFVQKYVQKALIEATIIRSNRKGINSYSDTVKQEESKSPTFGFFFLHKIEYWQNQILKIDVTRRKKWWEVDLWKIFHYFVSSSYFVVMQFFPSTLKNHSSWIVLTIFIHISLQFKTPKVSSISHFIQGKKYNCMKYKLPLH